MSWSHDGTHGCVTPVSTVVRFGHVLGVRPKTHPYRTRPRPAFRKRSYKTDSVSSGLGVKSVSCMPSGACTCVPVAPGRDNRRRNLLRAGRNEPPSGLCAVFDLERKPHDAGDPAPGFDRVDLLGLCSSPRASR